MDSRKKHTNPSPQKCANLFSKLFFCWIIPFFKHGYKNNLKTTDIYDILDEDKCEAYVQELQKNWEEELNTKKKKKPRLTNAIFKTFAKSYSYSGANIFFQAVVIKALIPIVLAEYIKYFDKSKKYNTLGENSGWILGAANVVLAFLYALLNHHSQIDSQRVGMRVRVALSSLVYRKLLKLNQTSLSKTPAGKMVNLLSNDLQRIDICSQFLHFLWVMPLQATICFYILYHNMGVAVVAGTVALIIEGIPLQAYLSKKQGNLRSKIAEKTDHRIKLISEVLSGIKVIKMYAWEKYFAKIVNLARCEEVQKIYTTSKIKGVNAALMVITERFGLYCSVIVFVLLGNRLKADQVFACAQLYNSLQMFLCYNFPNATSSYAEATVSIRRIQKFLLLEENGGITRPDEIIYKKGSISIEKVSCSWNGSNEITLNNINLGINPGQLCCVVGSVGSGKTSLLKLLLRELPTSHGRVEICGNVSYASQEPWLFVSNVRNNILFGEPYEMERYDEVVQVCALKPDLLQFPFGDKTVVEERGVSLSGGQRARINLARAVYKKADIYLLDDPLSAVDIKVGKHLFEKCIKGYLGDKTRILVTHQLQFLQQADLIVIIENGKIKKLGTYNEVIDQAFILINSELEENKTQHAETVERSFENQSSVLENEPVENVEEIGEGTIPFSVYIKYFGYGTSLFGFIIMVFLFIIAQIASNAGDLCLTNWINHENEIYNQTSIETLANQDNILNYTLYSYTILADQLDTKYDYYQVKYMIIYSIFMAAALILTPIRSLNFTRVVMNSSRNLHNKMFSNVLEAPMKFFDTNPSGRILSRFSNDMGIIDEVIPKAYIDFIQIIMVLIGILVVIFISSPYMIVPALVLAVVFLYIRALYLKTAQDIKRLEGVNRAPVFSHLVATIDGMTTIRSSKAEQMITKEFDELLDQHSGTWYLYLAANEIFGFYLDFLSTIFIAIVTLQFLLFQESYADSSGNIGLSVSQCLILTGMLQYGIRQTAEVSNNMISVERVLQITNLKRETHGEEKSKQTAVETYKSLNKDWPERGGIVFRNLYLKYNPEDEPVLKNLNLVINPGEKVGVVGRTGAGKSSLVAALFRLTSIEGTVIIDGVDTTKIKLNELRSKISIIPQEPVLFSATLRYNLDPFGSVTDEEIWNALENVELKGAVNSLDMEITEGGSNFSTGQRQLLCLARAIIRNNKILVLDEATANVDPNTDELIQKTIRKNFKNSTVITIAHRLVTIMDSDKVLVMEAGRHIEYDHPHILLEKDEGHFSKMLEESGSETEKYLREIAKKHYNKTIGEQKA